MDNILKKIFNIFLFLGSPLTLISSLWLKLVKKSDTSRIGDKIFMSVGILPIVDQYYQPLINPKKHLTRSLRNDRCLPGIDFNDKEQLDLLSQFHYQQELLTFPIHKTKNKTQDHVFHYNNDAYEAGDAEYLYSLIRHLKPKRMIEIGSGYSTLIARSALKKMHRKMPIIHVTIYASNPTKCHGSMISA